MVSEVSESLYSDSQVEIRPDSITFHQYYFPRGDKTLPLDEIEGIYWWEPTLWSGKYRYWGSGDFRTWCPKDYKRHRRDRMFLIIKRNHWSRIAFTVEDSRRVMEVLEDLELPVSDIKNLRKDTREDG